jgi:hypothetical protein
MQEVVLVTLKKWMSIDKWDSIVYQVLNLSKQNKVEFLKLIIIFPDRREQVRNY